MIEIFEKRVQNEQTSILYGQLFLVVKQWVRVDEADPLADLTANCSATAPRASTALSGYYVYSLLLTVTSVFSL